MGGKTSQLQIRVSPQQKAMLKRLAQHAGLNVSQYVLATVLPTGQAEFRRHVEALEPREDRLHALYELRNYLSDLPLARMGVTLEGLDVELFPPVVQNYAAALVEEEALRRTLDVPEWVERVKPLSEPHFAWDTRSLRPHLIRITPMAFKRRNAFVDAAGVEGAPDRAPKSLPEAPEGPLTRLNTALQARGLLCELGTVAGALMSLVLAADPPTRRITAMFRPHTLLSDCLAEVSSDLGLTSRWLPDTVAARLDGGRGLQGSVELSNLRVFRPPSAYLFAMKCAATGVSRDAEDVQDLRFLARILNLSSPAEGREAALRYFSDRQLPPELESTLEACWD